MQAQQSSKNNGIKKKKNEIFQLSSPLFVESRILSYLWKVKVVFEFWIILMKDYNSELCIQK